MMLMASLIEQALGENLNAAKVTLHDDSHKHAGHNPDAAKGGTHFRIKVVSPDFAGQSRLARQKLVMAALKPLFDRGLHAAAITTMTPDEAGAV